MSAPRIVLAGATGYLGTNLRRRLPVERFAGVVVRRPDAGFPGKTWLIGAEGIPAGPADAAAEGAVLVHLIGGGRGKRARDIHDMNVGVTEHLVAFARRAGIRRIVYMSGYGVGDGSSSAYFQAKREAEEIVRASGIDHAILRCSYVLGGEDEFKPWLIDSLAAGVLSVPGSAAYRIQPVHVADLMDCFSALVEAPQALNATYDFIGEPIAFGDFLDRMLARIGRPARIARSSIEDLVRDTVSNPTPVFSLDELAILVSDVVGPWTTDLFGTRPRPAADVIETLAAELAEIEMRMEDSA
ncbi:MAG TPA: NAD(P)H-binding protein [Bauldia sp.]|nr:NAD(P)H-binding protein [Bauldia sp.]